MAKRRVPSALPINLVRASAENLPFEDRSFDAILTTWTLCTIPDALKALREMHRVLRPAGHLVFVEHGLAPERGVARWQERLTPCWKRIGGGCHLNRRMDDLIQAAGFRIDELRTGYMRGPKLFTFMYEGSATPRLS
jgi:SAM-dependent methyltransferase